MLVYEDKKQKFLNFLKAGFNPFKKFVATGEIKEDLGVVETRKDLLNSIIDKINGSQNFILPIIGKVGTGKTHLFWALKKSLHYYNTIYISLENVYRKFYYNLYSEFIEEMGVEVLRSIISELCQGWGSLERKFGFFHVADINKVRKNAFKQQSPEFEDKIALNDVINVITAHQLDPYKNVEAENWLLGGLMDFKDLSHLNLLYDLRKKSYAFTMLKFLIENSKLGSVLFIDDFENIISLMKPEEGTEEIFDPSYLYGSEINTPESVAARKSLNKILKLIKIKGLRIIITLKSFAALEEIKSIIREKDESLVSVFSDAVVLSEFEESDLFQFYRKSIKKFLKNVNFLEFYEDIPDTYYPLNQKVLKNIFNNTNGNPREIIKILIKIFNDIIYSDQELETILEKYESNEIL
ncbi:MAG: hypothetical protein EU539_05255 [Promethearchaeota archaeon]|nr:MAG: hypothetical protein EU539_05255 [Candidatus Lokiarchaeota archaeon]